jgi:IS1 family transposase
MKCGILSAQKNKLWLIKAVDHRTGKTVAWVLGNRDTATFQRLYGKVRHLTGRAFYTDELEGFRENTASRAACSRQSAYN